MSLVSFRYSVSNFLKCWVEDSQAKFLVYLRIIIDATTYTEDRSSVGHSFQRLIDGFFLSITDKVRGEKDSTPTALLNSVKYLCFNRLTRHTILIMSQI